MSSFTCPHCQTAILDTPSGYITGCEHFPLLVICDQPGCLEVAIRRTPIGLDGYRHTCGEHEPKETVA